MHSSHVIPYIRTTEEELFTNITGSNVCNAMGLIKVFGEVMKTFGIIFTQCTSVERRD